MFSAYCGFESVGFSGVAGAGGVTVAGWAGVGVAIGNIAIGVAIGAALEKRNPGQ